MIELLVAVVAAALLGSLHCVGMCGPMAVLAAGGMAPLTTDGGLKSSRWDTSLRITSYHFGRWMTYALLGMLAGSAALLFDIGAAAAGVSSAAARFAGMLLIGLGAWQLVKWYWPAVTQGGQGKWSTWIARRLAAFRAVIQDLSPPVRAGAIGALTTLLPCGWLYVFVLVAAGTAHPLSALAVMSAFWIGTLPALTAVAGGWKQFGQRVGGYLPIFTAAMLITAGAYTATGRAATNLRPLHAKAAAVARQVKPEDNPSLETLRVLQGEPLPCCRND